MDRAVVFISFVGIVGASHLKFCALPPQRAVVNAVAIFHQSEKGLDLMFTRKTGLRLPAGSRVRQGSKSCFIHCSAALDASEGIQPGLLRCCHAQVDPPEEVMKFTTGLTSLKLVLTRRLA